MREVGWGRGFGAALAGVVTCLGVLLPAAPATAQANSPLERIDAQVRDGRVGQAREALLEWWDRAWDGASRTERERALWLRGRLTLDPGEAASSYRRILAEFPGGRFADQALLRMGWLAAAQGDTTSAYRWFTILQRDYPNSPARLEAATWLAEPAVRDALARPADERRGAAEPPADRAAPARAGTGAGTGTAPASESESATHALQLGAFSERDRAEVLAARVREAGFAPRIVRVPGSSLWRVRTGRFRDDAAARGLYDEVRNAGFDVVTVTDADREQGGR